MNGFKKLEKGTLRNKLLVALHSCFYIILLQTWSKVWLHVSCKDSKDFSVLGYLMNTVLRGNTQLSLCIVCEIEILSYTRSTMHD